VQQNEKSLEKNILKFSPIGLDDKIVSFISLCSAAKWAAENRFLPMIIFEKSNIQ